MFCSRCGQQLPDAVQACPYCGQPVDFQGQPAPAAAPAPPPPAVYYHRPESPRGVGGWLLFFCIMLAIVWPLWVVAQYFSFRFIFSFFVVAGWVRLVLGIAAGIVLWTGNSAGMTLLRIYFVLSALLSAIGVFNLMQFAVRYHNPGLFLSFGVIRVTGMSLVFLAAGVLYFSLSERVRATYGSKLFG